MTHPGDVPNTGLLSRLFEQEDLNFLVTNRIPRRYATLFMNWFSRIESPALARLSIETWRLFADDLHLEEAKDLAFTSLHDCFIRELRPGARPIDPDPAVLVSPCDAVVGTHGRVERGTLLQAKGLTYHLEDLVPGPELQGFEDGRYVTLRLKSNMYHRFHAPCDAHIERITYHSGDTWNVNPIALKRVENLFCKNERVVLSLDLPTQPGAGLLLVAVASILVASVKLHCLAGPLDLRYRGPNVLTPDRSILSKGEEVGYFESGSTIIVVARGPFELADHLREGQTIRVGQPLLRRTTSQPADTGTKRSTP